MKPSFYLVFIAFFASFKLQAQSVIAEELTYHDGWYISLTNYTDPFMGFTSYQAVGQTFQSPLNTTVSTIEFFISNFNTGGTVDMEIYSCSNQNTWGSLLGTKTGIPINAMGWVSVNVSSLNIAVTSGNYYGFKLLPQAPLNAGIGIANTSYDDGEGWATNGFTGYDYPFKVTSFITLPTEIISFKTALQGNKVAIDWRTVSEQNSKNFIIEHSSDGNSWTDIATVNAAGTSNTLKAYSYTHNSPVQGVNFYRLQQTDLDGKSRYGEIRSIKLNTPQPAFLVMANPVINRVLRVQVNTASNFSFYSTDGRLIWKKQFEPGTQNIQLEGYGKGVFFLKDNQTTKTIIVQ
jgi:hypothetical protein